MIVLDTTVLAYAVGREHPLRAPARRVVAAVDEHGLDARTAVEVIQEFVHVRARRGTRADAGALARRYAVLLSPLLSPTATHLEDGLDLFGRHARLVCASSTWPGTSWTRC